MARLELERGTDVLLLETGDALLLETVIQVVGGGAVAIAGTLGLLTKLSVGAGAIAIAGTLGRVIKLSVGSGAIAISGALSSALTIFQVVGSGSIAIAGTLGRVTKLSVIYLTFTSIFTQGTFILTSFFFVMPPL